MDRDDAHGLLIMAMVVLIDGAMVVAHLAAILVVVMLFFL